MIYSDPMAGQSSGMLTVRTFIIFSVSVNVLSLRKSAKVIFPQYPPVQWKASGWVCLSVIREGCDL